MHIIPQLRIYRRDWFSDHEWLTAGSKTGASVDLK